MTSSPTPSERELKNAEAAAKEAAEQAQLPYRWTQTIKDVDITVPVPGTLKGRDFVVKISREHLTVGVKGQEPIIDGPLPHSILADESTWTLSTSASPSTKDLALHLDKSNQMQWWDAVTTNAPFKIDTQRIVPENSQLGDLDGETRGMVEKMMFDQRQKETGGETSEEGRKRALLEGFKRQHPEMDFSQAKMG